MPRKFKAEKAPRSSGSAAEEMTPAEFRQAMAEKPVIIVATGILEWHGNHLPLGTDALKVRGIAEVLAEESGAILLPQNWFGVVGFDEMLGTITFSKPLVKQMILELFENLEKMGARVIVFLTGHYGRFQVETIKEAAEEYRTRSKVRIIAQPEWEGVDWSAFPCEPDHADKYETSLMMALYPQLVQMDEWRPELEIPYDYQARPNAWGFVSPKGTWRFSEDFQEHASPALGERCLRAIVDHLKKRIEEELSAGGDSTCAGRR